MRFLRISRNAAMASSLLTFFAVRFCLLLPSSGPPRFFCVHKIIGLAGQHNVADNHFYTHLPFLTRRCSSLFFFFPCSIVPVFVAFEIIIVDFLLPLYGGDSMNDEM